MRVNEPAGIGGGPEWVAATLDALGAAAVPDAAALMQRLAPVLPAGYDEMSWPNSAAVDLPIIDRLLQRGEGVETSMMQFVEAAPDEWRFRVYRVGVPVPLSDLLPLLDQLGMRALDERSFPFKGDGGVTVWLHDVGVQVALGELQPAMRAEAQRTFLAALAGTIEVDGFNRLVLAAGLAARQVEVVRAYSRYLRQIGFPLGQQYIEDTRIYRTSPPYFIDKMPNNFRHVGLIKLILPNAKIIDARREPMACCFGNLKQLFARGQEFCYSVDDIARYYRTYLELMKHWEEVLPGQILRVHHEDVVDDLEGSVRRLLDFLGLPFEQACLEFHKNVRSVKTASSEQVRQPIYREGLDQWRRYEPWLSELRKKLGDAVTRYRD